MKIKTALLAVLMASCSISKDLVKIKFKPRESYPMYLLEVPKDYELKILSVTVEKEYQFAYRDSSMIYLTNFGNTPNYENIKKMGDSIFNYRFQNDEMTEEINQIMGREVIKVLPDTFELSGIDGNSLFWKDIKVGKISIGYQNVTKYRKELFDKSLKTLRIRL
ncbi:MAG: hypothetical protein GX587_16620 [Bacteroidales bacterium]|nr:hypothetical protein [Bacteroidales bacterium]